MADIFEACLVADVSKLKGYGKKRIAEAVLAYTRIRDSHLAAGETPTSAGGQAMTHVLDEINAEILRKKVTLQHNIGIMASADERFTFAVTKLKTTVGGLEVKIAQAMRSFHEDVPTIPNAPSVRGEENRLAGLYRGMLLRVSDKLTVRGKYGIKPPKEQMADVVSEFHGGKTGNVEAADTVAKLREIFALSYAIQRSYGAKVRAYSPDEPLPIGHSPNKLLKNDGALSAAFVADHKNWLDFSTMRWPDGRRILPGEQDMYLNGARNVVQSGGKYSGYASHWGDDFDAAFAREIMDSRGLRYKDAASWQAAHDKYSDGNVFTTLQSVLTQLVRDEAKVKVFGTNSDRMAATIAAMGQKRLADMASKGSTAAQAAIPRLNFHIRRFHVENVMAMRSNAMDPNSGLALTVGATTDLVTTAQLGSALVANVMGDAVNMISLTMAENRGMHSLVRTLAEYVKAQMPGNAHSTLLDGQRFGYAFDDLIFNDVQTTRLDLASTVSPTITKAWARAWTVAGGVPRHTNALRAAVLKGTLMDMGHWKNFKLSDTPLAFQTMMKRAGIDASMWEQVRASMATVEVRPGVHQYDPIQSYVSMKRELAERMHRALVSEVNGQVLLPTNEAAVKMRAGLRPDTVPGAVLGSVAMYTAQPMAAAYSVMRTILNAQMSTGKRTATYAAFGLMMVGTGALGVQLRAAIAGREFEDMADVNFWGKALIAGGAFNIWGSYLSGFTEEDSSMLYKQLAGPLIGGVIDIGHASIETGSQMLGISDDTDGLRHLATAIERYIGPKPFYAAAVLNREIYERLKEFSDRPGYRRSVSTRVNNAKERGQVYRPGWKPSDRPVTDWITGQ